MTDFPTLYIPQLVKSLPFYIPEARKKNPFRAEPPLTGHYIYLISIYIHNAISDQLPMTCGVPQGSILGPLLFSIYTNELPSIPHHSSSQCYVDDTKLILNFNLQDQTNAIAKLNEDFKYAELVIGPLEISSL